MKKDDAGKRDWLLIPWGSLVPVVRVLEFGASKYGRENWRTVIPFRERYTKALLRHVIAYTNGESTDPDTGESHLAHAVCCALFLLAAPPDPT